MPQQTLEQQLRTARFLRGQGYELEQVLGFVDEDHRAGVRKAIIEDESFILVPPTMVLGPEAPQEWLSHVDRSAWHYWPALRQYLLGTKGWSIAAVRSLDDASDRVLQRLSSPSASRFDVRGLVLGRVQSGKTSNYTSLIAKAADAGYRLVIVLAGIDNGLRLQTNLRLKQELVGYSDGRTRAVPLPPIGKQWHEFTRAELDGDFQPGYANHAALQGSQPVLLVVKKNGSVLRRLLGWLEAAPAGVRSVLPVLVIDDEADQASIDTRGTRRVTDDGEAFDDDEPPSVINGLIRDLLQRFDRVAYVAYTATPFANVLIPHDAVDPEFGSDLYPRDFIIDLPKPNGYFGAEEIFGRADPATGDQIAGLDVVRIISETAADDLDDGRTPEDLRRAIIDFALAGAARTLRGHAAPATMLVHTSQLTAVHDRVTDLVDDTFRELRDTWRYYRHHGLEEELRRRWESEFRPVTRYSHIELDAAFDTLVPHVGPFLEAVQVRQINSATGQVLDYEREPLLKAIAIGGNRLSRGLTLEGLLVSFFGRRSVTYDALMQMGRWFGFRSGYEDLTRIWTTAELARWFTDLAQVEYRLREDIAIYEREGLTPYQLGLRIAQHPAMEVTSRLKRRFATEIRLTYSLTLEQSIHFPFDRPEELVQLADDNQAAVRNFARALGPADAQISGRKGPAWAGVRAATVLSFLERFQLDDRVRTMDLAAIREYIDRMVAVGELTDWIIAVRGRGTADRQLGTANWALPSGPVNQISRSRLKSDSSSLGVIVDPEDEAVGLDTTRRGKDARAERPSRQGVLLLYPISRWSGYEASEGSNRQRLFDDPGSPLARDLVGIALSLPQSARAVVVERYVQGTAGSSAF